MKTLLSILIGFVTSMIVSTIGAFLLGSNLDEEADPHTFPLILVALFLGFLSGCLYYFKKVNWVKVLRVFVFFIIFGLVFGVVLGPIHLLFLSLFGGPAIETAIYYFWLLFDLFIISIFSLLVLCINNKNSFGEEIWEIFNKGKGW